jgi:hypothetical protein
MFETLFEYEFEGAPYHAWFIEWVYPDKREFRVSIKSPALMNQFGSSFKIIYNSSGEYVYGYPNVSKGAEYLAALTRGLKEFNSNILNKKS